VTGPIRIATRTSRLARWQADYVAERLRAHHPGLAIEMVEVVTRGDQVRDRALAAIGEHGLFTRALEEVLLAGGADLAVHSLKDMETSLPSGLEILAVPERADPRDAWLCPAGQSLEEIASGARIGTSSIRRKAQLLARRPDLTFADLRGNVPTRISKLAQGAGGLQAAVLAWAGLERLGLLAHVTAALTPAVMVPAVGQGALAIEGRAADPLLRDLLAPLEHAPSRIAVRAERAFLRRLGGGCQVPAGALGRVANGVLELVVCALDGSAVIREAMRGPDTDPEGLGTRLADQLLARGGRQILAGIAARDRAAGNPRLVK
jgi:hydroxymethylbilane synthase